MELIPAIDILDSIVVKATSGQRKKYKSIQSQLINSSKLENIVKSLLQEYKFKKIYIADLNSIMGKSNNLEIIKKVAKKFLQIDFWVDYGVSTSIDFKKFDNLLFKTIVGSETLRDIKELKKIYGLSKKEIILSLDFKNNNLLGPKDLIDNNKNWPKKTIFMMMDSIGSRKKPELTQLKRFFLDKKKDYYIAGGVSNNEDINFFKKKGFKGAILSTAIHEKKIIYKNL